MYVSAIEHVTYFLIETPEVKGLDFPKLTLKLA